ncbi:MAG: FAD-dependent oxidoreductase [Gemmatimonadetes bacterium]|nr:FAD-dependent oxidoreductase [Gemmatimonadota bacterium]
MRTQVAIVGGGLAGLYAARLLHAAKVEWMLIEARDRLGGRILTVDEAGQPADDGFDLGPSWYWPRMQPVLAGLVAELGLSSFEQHSDGDVVFERMSRETPQRFRPVVQDQQSFRVAGGTGALVHAVARGLPRERLVLSAQVTAMALRGEHVELVIRHADGADETLVVGHVIAAIPPRLLEATVSFTPEQEASVARRWRDTPTWMAPHAKFFAVYDRPFWRDAGLSGTAQSMVGPMAEMHDATTASGGPGLFGFLRVDAEQRAALGEEALTRACLDQLARVFGPDARTPRAILFKDWAADPRTATAADRSAGGHPAPDPAPWVTGPWKEHLALAGSETSPTEPGYLAGAVGEAGRAVAELIKKLGAGGSRVGRSSD